MLTVAVGRPYDIEPDDLVGSRDGMYPRLALDDHGLGSIIASCADIDAAVDAALEAATTLYPPLVCRVDDMHGGVVVPVIQN